MKIEIWSDIVCPFCYIGKRQFDEALALFKHRDEVEVVWHSYQLFPDYEQKEGSDFYTEVGRLKGNNREWSICFHNQITEHARRVGLEYNFEKIPFPNTFNAHRFSLYAKTKGVQHEAEEKLFRAYFTEGRNIGDLEVLAQLGEEIDLPNADVREALSGNQFSQLVRKDIAEAQRIGVNGVPFFLINGELAVAGAQDPNGFVKVLNRAWEKWSIENHKALIGIVEGTTCDVQGNCK